jgi:hypothetical protein
MQIELRDLDWSLDAGHHAGLHRVSDDAMAPLSENSTKRANYAVD